MSRDQAKAGVPAMTRRRFLSSTGAAVAAASLLAACGEGGSAGGQASGNVWKQFSGTKLNFISENTPPTSAIAANLRPFTDKTGIQVNIEQTDLASLVRKVGLDLSSGQGTYHVIYADPYQVLAPFREGLVDLNTFLDDDSLPSVPKGVEDFIPTQLDAAGRFESRERLYALPYDCPTMIWIYRKDIIEKHRAQMRDDLGFDPMPSESSTWDQYFQIAQWLNDNQDEVPYGTGHQAKQHDSLMCDFSNVLWAHGGQYFRNDKQVGRLGTTEPGPALLDQPNAVRAAEFYNRLLSIAHPGSTSWDWTGVDEAFRAGEIAMTPNWHEFAAGIESSDLGGKVGYMRLPTGPVRSANMYGGTGIGVSSVVSEEEQKAAWLFLVWATSPETQLRGLKSDVGGGTPTRTSVYNLPEVKQNRQPPTDMPNLLTTEAVFEAWKPENAGLRPKIPTWNECDTIIFTNLSQMVAGEKSPEQAMTDAKRGFDKTNDV